MKTPLEQKDRSRTRDGRASLATLAAHLKLSPAAISRVLNGAPAARSIPKSTQERIFEAARTLNYRPNVLARSLRRGQSLTLGVLVPEIAEGYTALVLSGLEQRLGEAGYYYLLISHHHRPEAIERSLATLAERAVDGVVAIDTALPEHVSLPLVTLSSPALHPGAINIRLNHTLAAELAIRYLTEQGHRQIAVIKGQVFSSDTEVRWQATSAAATAHGVPLHPSLVTQLQGEEPSNEPGYFAAQRLLSQQEPFTALIAFNDVSAIGAIRALREAGRRVPQDVSVMGFDDIASAAFQNPSLTTIRQPLRSMGMLAAEAILGRIRGEKPVSESPVVLQVDPELVSRESVQRVAASLAQADLTSA